MENINRSKRKKVKTYRFDDIVVHKNRFNKLDMKYSY